MTASIWGPGYAPAIPAAGHVTPTSFGAVGDGVTDDTLALQAWAASPLTRVGESRTFKTTSSINVGANPRIDFRGMVIDASTAVALTGNAVVRTAGALTAISALSVSPVKGARALTFTAAHGLTLNDVIILYNPTDYSWNTTRTYYRAGEFVQVFAVPTATTLTAWTPFYSGYSFGSMDVYKIPAQDVQLSNLRVICPAIGVSGVSVSLATYVHLENIQCSGSTYSTIDIDRCFNVSIVSSNCYVNDSTAGDRYGLSIGNSQGVRVWGGRYSGRRHSISIGGGDFAGAVPVRDCQILNSTLTNDFAASIPSADVHGNAEGIRYIGCTIYGGAELGGKDCYYHDCDIFESNAGNAALIYGSSEWLGGLASVKHCRLRSASAYSLGTVYAQVTANSLADTHLIVDSCEVESGSCDTFARVDFPGVAFKGNASITNITFTGDSASIVAILRMSGAGADGDYVIVDRINNAPIGAFLYLALLGYGATVKVRLMAQSGVASVVPVSAAAQAQLAVTWRYTYGSKTPVVHTTPKVGTVNGRTIMTFPGAVVASGANITFRMCDSANAGVATPNVDVAWTASLAEI